MPLLSLPLDILLSILVLLSPEDILIVSVTCRVLHKHTLNDYLWHQILKTHHLPLDIEPYVDRNHLPGPKLQAILTRALHVDHNWRKPNPRIKEITRLGDMDGVCQMQFLSEWLVVLRRSPASLSVWRVGSRPYRAAMIDLQGEFPLNFCATIRAGGGEVLVAIISGARSTTNGRSHTTLSAYSVALKSQLDDDESASVFTLPAPSVIFKIQRPQSEGRFYEVHVCGDIIAVGIPQFVNQALFPSAYRILIINAATGVQCSIDPRFDPTEELTQLHFQVYTQKLVLTAIRNQSTVLVRVHDLPAAVFTIAGNSIGTESPILVDSLATPTAEYESSPISDVDCHLSATSMRSISHMSCIAFRPTFHLGDDYILHFPLDRPPYPVGEDGPSKPSFACPFRTDSENGVSTELVCLGETGHRAIWLERRWSSDEYTLVKAAFSPVGDKPAIVQPLFPRHFALPFELHTCQCLAFEEATGTVCLAVHTGELYILQF
ncbi:hypothetical protein C8R45DRAFT_963063 [Mycena sanguinolenta]|nr:hypothetical protein C8R45DRAFT_963063 [Mycena sanguinolenta]